MHFEIVSDVTSIEVSAVGRSIRELPQLRKRFGAGRWRKLKGVADVRLRDGAVVRAEVHGNESHGVGRRKMKVQRFLE